MTDLRLSYWRVAKRLLQYLNRIMTLGLEYGPDVEYYKTFYSVPDQVNYADSHYANDIKSR